MKSPRENVGGQHFTCYDVIQDVDAAVRAGLSADQNYFVVGGVASKALGHDTTRIDRLGHAVVVTKASDIATMRDNGTERDIDVLVDAVLSKEDAAVITSNIGYSIDHRLKVSVFGIDRHVETVGPVKRLSWNLLQWMSQRTLDATGVRRYELYPLERVVDPKSYEPWTLTLPSGKQVSMLHPAGHTLAYGTRSIGGVRPKDNKPENGESLGKVAAMRARILPLFSEEVYDGPFSQWDAFAKDIEMLRTLSRVSADGRRAVFRPYDTTMFRKKAQVLHWLESHEGIVDFAQGETMQRVLNPFVRAK